MLVKVHDQGHGRPHRIAAAVGQDLRDIEHLKTYFGSYRTLRLRLPGDVWEETIIDESKTDVMSVIAEHQKKGKILDIKLEEISTEEVIKKIYEGETK